MNLIKNELVYVDFNQDSTCLTVGTKTGYSIYALEPFQRILNVKDMGGTGIIEVLFNSSLVVLVGSGDNPTFSSRRLLLHNTASKTNNL